MGIITEEKDPELNKNRLSWRCRRGMLELDLLLQGFMQQGYEKLTDADKRVFVVLLDYPDAVLFDLLMGQSVSSDPEIDRVVEKIRSAASS